MMKKKKLHSTKPILKIKGLSFRYPEQLEPVLNGIYLKLYPHEIRVIVGASGCGKSTLTSAICGFIPNSIDGEFRGSVEVAGKVNEDMNIYEIAKEISLVQQDVEAQLCTTDVFHELAFALENFNKPRTEIIKRIEWVLDVLGIESLKDRELNTLSGGEKQKVAIASMLVLKPKVLVFDEPTANLDPKAAQDVIRVIDELRYRSDIGILIVDHNPSQYYHIADHILVLKNGVIEHILSAHQYKDFNAKYYQPVFNKTGKFLNFQSRTDKKIENPLYDQISKYQESNETKKTNIHKKNIINIRDLEFAYGKNQVLKNISFSIDEGEFIALMGDNGSGKTTLIQNIIKLLPPQKGGIIYTFKGFTHGKRTVETSELAKDIGFVFQNPNHMIFGSTVWDEVMLGPKNLFSDPKFAIENARELLRIGELLKYRKTHPLLLSHGEKRRVNLASILCYDPRIIILDEPFIGQDPENISKILDYLLNLVHRGKSVLMITHRIEIVQKYCSRLLFLKNGELVLDEEPGKAFEKLMKNGEDSYIPMNISSPGGELDGA